MAEKKAAKLFQRAFVFRFGRIILLAFVLGSAIYGIVAAVYATKTIFKVKMNYAVVLEKLGGKRQAVTDIGWHVRLPFFTKIEQEVTLMNQTLFLGGSNEPMRIISQENVALWTSALLTYRITDLKTWAIENLKPMILLQGDYDGIVKDIMQAEPVNKLISDRQQVKEKIFKALKSQPINEGGPSLEEKYGIEIISFVLKETRFGDKLVEATEEKKRRELIAEAENYAADQEASRIRKLYAAYLEGISSLQKEIGRQDGSTDTSLLQFLVQQKWASAYEKNQTGQNTVVIQNTEKIPAITLPLSETTPAPEEVE
ncbi:MAG: SPFH domain-containing protein [Desulfofustis sp.]|nr:SPFH domain-containing protein [Desulfofustis sp.]RZW20184.1 MAG: SPFH domain-containing protein [Desulfobulbaceae bacterium]MBT8346229.1 SPFH domain-containing protein [Desulfofustis sp.]MBT8353746.1 SPFH domain-containing protein [Desulfofustis sp.]NNF46451.1 SPFH domain-containing protein [Desulfofustis sp.]